MSVATFDAQVIAAFGRHLLVRDERGQEFKARPFGRGLTIACGDEVSCRHGEHHAEVHVLKVLPRRTAIYRSNVRGGSEPVLANLTRLLVVVAPVPQPDLFIVDRYLAAAESAGIATSLVLNKADLGVDAAVRDQLQAYEAAGYAWIATSASTGEGMEALSNACIADVTALVGQSGVGKSSLARHLLPGADIAVSDLMRTAEGRHTTTASRLFDLPEGGQLMDSPGVRDFAPAIEHLDPRHLGFIEVARLAGGCRFLDCRHFREPDCAVRAAVDAGTIHPRRYESYRRLRRLRETLLDAQGPRTRR